MKKSTKKAPVDSIEKIVAVAPQLPETSPFTVKPANHIVIDGNIVPDPTLHNPGVNSINQ